MLPAGINGATGQVHVDDDRVILGLSDKVAIASDEIAVGLEAVGLERRTGAGIRWSRTRGATTTLRASPTGPDSTGASIFARGGDARLVSLTAHQMASVWPEFKRELRRP